MPTYLGEDYTVKATITDKDGSLLDPDSHNIILKDPNRSSRASSSTPTHMSLGIFEETFLIPPTGPAGVWTVEWEAVTAGESEIERFSFGVME